MTKTFGIGAEKRGKKLLKITSELRFIIILVKKRKELVSVLHAIVEVLDLNAEMAAVVMLVVQMAKLSSIK